MGRTINGIRKIKYHYIRNKKILLESTRNGRTQMGRRGHSRPQDSGMMIYSGAKSTGVCGLGFYLCSDMEKALMGYNPVIERIVLLRIRGRHRNLTTSV